MQNDTLTKVVGQGEDSHPKKSSFCIDLIFYGIMEKIIVLNKLEHFTMLKIDNYPCPHFLNCHVGEPQSNTLRMELCKNQSLNIQSVVFLLRTACDCSALCQLILGLLWYLEMAAN